MAADFRHTYRVSSDSLYNYGNPDNVANGVPLRGLIPYRDHDRLITRISGFVTAIPSSTPPVAVCAIHTRDVRNAVLMPLEIMDSVNGVYYVSQDLTNPLFVKSDETPYAQPFPVVGTNQGGVTLVIEFSYININGIPPDRYYQP